MTAAGLVLVGIVAGALAASLGLGGGVVFVPALVVFFDFGQHTAQGTSLAVVLPTAMMGAYIHSRYGRVRWRLAAGIAVGAIAGGIVGAQLALALDDASLKRLFALLLAVIAVRMFVRGERQARDSAR